LDAGVDSAGKAEVGGLPDEASPRVCPLDQLGRPIARAIVDADHVELTLCGVRAHRVEAAAYHVHPIPHRYHNAGAHKTITPLSSIIAPPRDTGTVIHPPARSG